MVDPFRLLSQLVSQCCRGVGGAGALLGGSRSHETLVRQDVTGRIKRQPLPARLEQTPCLERRASGRSFQTCYPLVLVSNLEHSFVMM